MTSQRSIPCQTRDDGQDALAFANFMRATKKTPPRGAITATILAGEQVFIRAGCAACHIASITTAPEGTVINGGKLTVRPAVANKVIHLSSTDRAALLAFLNPL
ncbi:MAG: hypothetical protein DMF89_02680 [Acidobacteria bacterium]|nr:MAG: hypothetical protein DMF89_02680 [Acidobacteriota bacterium]